MHVIVALVAGLVGALLSEGSLFGFVFGAMAGWLLVSQRRLQSDLARLHLRLARFELPAGSEQPPRAPPVAAPATVTPAAPAVERREPPPAIQPAHVASPARTHAAPQRSPVRAEATAPDLAERAAALLKRWFTEGNVPVKIGMLVLFFGVGALLKYAADQGMFAVPVEVWLIAVGAAGAAALMFGWRQRQTRPLFALALQGGAIGVLLITVFAAYRIFALLPAGLAFALLLILVAGSGLLALLQNALALAVLGSVGGFLAPLLVSTGTGNHVALFAYYALLNAAIFAIAWVRPWRVLNLVGFAFTFGVGTLWGYQYYRPEHFATVAPFLLLFFLFYVVIAVLYALRQPGARRGLVDGTLVFGAPLLAFPLQAALLAGKPMALAYSALALAVMYGVLARLLIHRAGLQTLALSFAALAVGFATLAVPLALDADFTAGIWALEGAALVWLALRQQRRLPLIAGVLLQLMAGIAWAFGFMEAMDARPIVNGPFLSGLLLAGAAGFSAWRLDRDGGWTWLAAPGLALGVLWWTLAGMHELWQLQHPQAALVGWLALSMALAAWLRRRLPWPRLAWPLLLAFAAALTIAVVLVTLDDAPLREWRAIAWAAWLAAALGALASLRHPLARGVSLAHVALLATLALLLGVELHHGLAAVTAAGTGWTRLGLVLPLALLTWASWRRPRLATFPLQDVFARYRLRWFAPASIALLLWWQLSLWHAGDAWPLPYLPLLNPLELAQFGVLALLLGLWRVQAPPLHQASVMITAALLAFATLSVATARTVHHLAGLSWDEHLLGAMLVQTSLTVVWSVLGMAAWIWGSQRGSRAVWLGGALLMGVVLAKLIVVDRSYMGNIAGIVSFLAVGLLLTVVGYFAPSPPRAERAERP
jgi:uncharacterized membrane protein